MAAKDNFLAEETAVEVVCSLTAIALKEVVSEGEALAVMNSENAAALQALAEVVEASIRETILKLAITKIRTIATINLLSIHLSYRTVINICRIERRTFSCHLY